MKPFKEICSNVVEEKAEPYEPGSPNLQQLRAERTTGFGGCLMGHCLRCVVGNATMAISAIALVSCGGATGEIHIAGVGQTLTKLEQSESPKPTEKEATRLARALAIQPEDVNKAAKTLAEQPHPTSLGQCELRTNLIAPSIAHARTLKMAVGPPSFIGHQPSLSGVVAVFPSPAAAISAFKALASNRHAECYVHLMTSRVTEEAGPLVESKREIKRVASPASAVSFKTASVAQTPVGEVPIYVTMTFVRKGVAVYLTYFSRPGSRGTFEPLEETTEAVLHRRALAEAS